MLLPSKVNANKLVLYHSSKSIIFIGHENNDYCFIYYIQENIIFYSIYVIFDKELFFKYTDSLLKDIRYSSHLIIQEY